MTPLPETTSESGFCKRFHKVTDRVSRDADACVDQKSNLFAAGILRRRLLSALPLALGGGLRHAQAATSGRSLLTVAAYPALDQIIREVLPRWREQHPDVEIRIVSREFGDHHSALTAAMATRKGLPDVMAVEFGFLARFAASGALADLSTLTGAGPDPDRQLVPFAAAQARFGGRLLAMPTDIGPGVMFYRNDVLGQAELAESDLLESWESYVEAGRKLRRTSGAYLIAHARDLKDAIVRTAIRPGDGIHFDSAGRSLLTSARFELAFRLAREVRRLDLDARVSAWSNDWSEGLRRGRIATQLMGAWFGGHLANWLAPATTGLWRSAPMPGRALAAWGGSFYAISASSANASLAWDLVRMLALDPAVQIEAFRRHDAFPALLSAQADAFLDEPLQFFGGQRVRALWRDIAQQIPPRAVHRLDPLADEIVSAELDKVLLRGKDPTQALGDADRMLDRRAARMRG